MTPALPRRLPAARRPAALGLVLVLLATTSVLQLHTAAPAVAACSDAPAAGVAIPPGAPRDPIIDRLGLDRAWALTQGEGVTVGVVDTGVDPTSPKLAGAVDTGTALTAVDTPAVFTKAPGTGEDCDGHGTQVAAIIAGRTAAGDDRMSGVAPLARIYPVEITGEIGSAPSALVGAAIRDAADHASVINLSFARPVMDDDVASAVAYAEAKDVVVVAAAGNENTTGSDGQDWYPAALPGVVAVAATGPDGLTLTTSNHGSWISVGAPGDSLTTVSRGGQGYVTVTGTSFAAAVVSGQAALIRARFPTMPATEVVRRLEATAVPPGDADAAGVDTTVGYGQIDPFASLSAALPAAAAVPSVVATAAAGRVAVPDLGAADPAVARRHQALGVSGLLAVAAVVALVAAIAVRAGHRRGWGRSRGRARVAAPVAPARTGAPVTSDGLGSDSDDVMVEANPDQLVSRPERS